MLRKESAPSHSWTLIWAMDLDNGPNSTRYASTRVVEMCRSPIRLISRNINVIKLIDSTDEDVHARTWSIIILSMALYY